MAQFLTIILADFLDPTFWSFGSDNGTVTHADASSIVVDLQNGFYDVYSGSFTYGDDGADGTIIAYQYADLTTTYTQMIIGSITVSTFDAYIDANNPIGLMAHIFSGADDIAGSTGNDTVAGFQGSDNVNGGAGNDFVLGGSGWADPSDSGDVVAGGAGSDLVLGNGGNDTLYGGSSAEDTSDAADLMYGGKGADILFGAAGNDTLYGGGSNVDPLDEADIISGGAGNDLIFGNGSADSISGDTGNDTIYGGVGDDIFYYGAFSGNDVLAQFDTPGAAEGDMIALVSNLNGSGILSVADALSHISYSEGNAVIDLGGDNSITITNIAPNALTASDFEIL